VQYYYDIDIQDDDDDDDDDAIHVSYLTIPLSFAASSWQALTSGKGQQLPT
jgi:hypothetical protein